MGEAISGASGFPILGRMCGTCLLSEIPEPPSDYIKEFWNVVNWDEAAARFAAKK